MQGNRNERKEIIYIAIHEKISIHKLVYKKLVYLNFEIVK